MKTLIITVENKDRKKTGKTLILRKKQPEKKPTEKIKYYKRIRKDRYFG